MYAETVYVIYQGVEFSVSVPCCPSTPEYELRRRAKEMIQRMFESNINIHIA